MLKRVLLVLILSAAVAAAAPKSSAKKFSGKRMRDEQRVVHALNRLAFGPRPGDVQKVAAMGVDRWIERQLAPEQIDDKALDARLAPLRTLRMSTPDMMAAFPSYQLIRAVAEGRQPMPTDTPRKLIYEVQVAQYRAQQKPQATPAVEPKPGETMMTPPPAGALPLREAKGAIATEASAPEDADAARRLAANLIALAPQKRMAALSEMTPEQLATLRFLRPDDRERVSAQLTPDERETLAAIANPSGVVTNELVEGKLLRAIYGERQLLEVMTDFWFNHFNIFIGKDADRFLITAYERDVLRRHALGKFKDLLTAVAEHPAMLYYLDNWQSTGPNSVAAQQAAKRAATNPSTPVPGLNENYARELMELHTLGVDGGYTQQDVREVARVFTGWTLQQPQQGARFQFDARRHEPGAKTVLGHAIAENG